jgi:superfamily II DNA/RNA helicase
VDVFSFRDALIQQYENFTRSFTKILSPDIKEFVDLEYGKQRYYPAPLIQLNPSFVSGGDIGHFVKEGLLHAECERIFRYGKTEDGLPGNPLTLHKHQEEAIRIAQKGESYVLTTGTGSGKSLSYFIPIVDHVLRAKTKGGHSGITAIVVYPMNALANSQLEELQKYLCLGYATGKEPVRFARYTGQESDQERQAIAANPPDILLTNYVMLELMLTRHSAPDPQIVEHAKGLKFLCLDELHTYRGRQGADVAMLVRRVRDRMNPNLLCVGTSATMASDGTAHDRSAVVAKIATRLFGSEVKPANIVTETLRRVTADGVKVDQTTLSAAINAPVPNEATYEDLSKHPVSVWVETNLGLAREDGKHDGKWIRTTSPMTLEQASESLAQASGKSPEICLRYLKEFLLLAFSKKDRLGRSLFAFRLHQFFAGAGDVYSTLESAGQRFLTLDGQQYKPQDRDKPLYNLCFCRSCGLEYHPIWFSAQQRQVSVIEPRELNEKSSDDEDQSWGYFCPYPDFDPDAQDSYPDNWIEFDRHGEFRLRPAFRKSQPLRFTCSPEGRSDHTGLDGFVIPGSFRFCLNPECDAIFEGAVRNEGSKLGSLSSEGRSSATTVMTIGAMKFLMGEDSIPKEAKKVLAFTDNRQDASLQAGHFNDFVMIVLLRGALLAAMREAGPDGLTDETLSQSIFQQLRLEPFDYSSNPEARGASAENAKRALRDVLGYRMFYDLRRGWRFTHPNLEQLGFLKIEYQSLDECAADQELWTKTHPLLASASVEVRHTLLNELLDIMRRGLCIKSVYLDTQQQEQIKIRSFSQLKDPWGLADDEKPQSASVMIPRPRPTNNTISQYAVFISSRSSFGKKVRARTTWKEAISQVDGPINDDLYNILVDHLLSVLRIYGLVEDVGLDNGGVGFRIPSSVLQWKIQDNSARSNAFFTSLYDNMAEMLRQGDRLLHSLQAREHTAQVDAKEREKREDDFRAASLPVMFCSPTMELGVDISTLNTVYMRNVPPTPANYAQRSGRAGRNGQPALVLTYCAARSPHDQYFFKDPKRMVTGVVTPPAIDLANEDLIHSHINAVWLAETGSKLGPSVRHVLEVGDANLPIIDQIEEQISQPQVTQRTSARVISLMSMLRDELTPENAPWYTADWLNHVVGSARLGLDKSFDRWRGLFKATTQQMERAHAITMNAALEPKARADAKARYDEARFQNTLLLDERANQNSDFYAYRYLASEGFLPGYNFPRLPLLAYIPARKERVGRDSFLSRPRFLGLSEFGPRSIIYHEGSTYRVKKAILTLRDSGDTSTSDKLTTTKVRLCPACGYGHFEAEAEFEKCVVCDSGLLGDNNLLPALYRIDQVGTRRVERISSDEEERVRQGYEIITTLRFSDQNGQRRQLPVAFMRDGESLIEGSYGPAATVWRVNLGWKRRKHKSIYGFNIDTATGEWTKDEQAPEEGMEDAPTSQNVQRIIPYVEDRRNILLLQPKKRLLQSELTTLMYALKRGIEAVFQLEENELAVEPLPTKEFRNTILFFEAAEGGAGVLNRLVSDRDAMARVALRAIEISHWRSKSEQFRAIDDLEDVDHTCEAGCYRCLLSYSNQMDQKDIDRKSETVINLLCDLVSSEPKAGTVTGQTSGEAFDALYRQAGSRLEKEWLGYLKEYGYRLPEAAQPLMSDFGVQPDFAYHSTKSIIFIDGPHHDHNHTKKLDEKKRSALRDAGYKAIVFSYKREEWDSIFTQYSFVFGKAK